MNDHDKTKEQLEDELQELQQKYDSLKAIIDQDFAERARAEDALSRSEENLSITIHSIGDGMIATDNHGLIVRMNPVAERLCGWNLADAAGRPLAEVFNIINSETREPAADPVRKVFANGEITGLANHTSLISKNGNEYQIADSAAPIKNRDGEITGVVLVFSDVTETYAAQKLIEKNEARYRSLLSNLEAGIVVHAADTSIVMNNQRASDLLGLSDDQLRGKTATDPAWKFVSENNIPLLPEEYPVNSIANGRQPIKNQVLGISRPGKNGKAWVTVNGFPVLDDKGDISEIVISFIDITERKLAELSLQESESKYRTLIENIPQKIFMKDNNCLFSSVNQKFAADLDISPSEMEGKSDFDLFPHEVAEKYRADDLRIIETKQSMDVEEIYFKDGRETWINTIKTPVLNSDGNVTGICGIFGDISERKRAESELKSSEERYRTLIESISEGIILQEKNGRIVAWNASAERIFGITAKEVEGQVSTQLVWETFREDGSVFPPNEHPSLVTLETGEPGRNIVMGVRTREGAFSWININTNPIFRQNDSEPSAVVISFSDITERKLTEDTMTFLLSCGLPGAKEDFFESLARYLAETLQMEYVCIDRLEGDGLMAQTVAIFNRGKLESNVLYALRETPCGEVAVKHVCCYRSGVRRLFPNDAALQALNAESYVGTTLIDSKGQAIGLIAIIGDQPLKEAGRAESLLKLVAQRAAGEMERLKIVEEREKAEEALRSRENVLNKVFDVLPIGLWFADGHGRLIRGNPAGVKIWGAEPTVSLEEYGVFKARSLSSGKIIEPDDWALAHTIREGITVENELLEIDAFDGKKKIIINYTAPVLDDEGNIQGAIVVNQDITERKRADDSLIKSEKELKWAQKLSHIGSWYLDVATNKVEWSEELYRIFGCDPSQPPPLLNESQRLFTFQSLELLSTSIADTIESRVPYKIELEIIRNDGTSGWIWAMGEPVLDKDGKIAGLSGVVQDISEKKLIELKIIEAKEKAEASEEKYRLSEIDLLEAQRLAHIGSWHWDLETNLVSWSRELYNINGHNPEIPVPAFVDMASFYSAKSWKALDEAIAKTLDTGEPFNLDLEMVKPDGTVQFTNTRGCANYNEAGEMINLHGTVQNITERKEYEEKLEDSLALLRIAGEKAKLGGWNVILEENRSFWSDEVAAIHEMPAGYAPLLEDGINFYAPEWRERIIEVFTDCAQRGIPYDEEMEIITGGGKRVWINTIGEAVRDADGKIFKVHGSFQDISERKETEKALIAAMEQAEKSEQKFRDMANLLPQVIFESDSVGNLTYVNKNAYEAFGFPDDFPIVGKSSLDFYTPESRLKAVENIRQRVAGNQGGGGNEYTMTRRDGSTFPALVYSNPIVSDGKPVGLRGIIVDITERKRAEETLRESEERFKNMFERHSSIMLLIEPESGRIIGANEASVRFYGYKKADLLAMRIDEINMLPSEQVSAELDRATHQENNYFVFPHRLSSGKVRTVEVHSTPIRYQDRQILFSIIHDITERRLAEEKIVNLNADLEMRVRQRTSQLEESNKELEAFSYSIAHDLRAPLRHINGYISLLNEQFRAILPEKALHYLSVVTNASKRMDTLISDLLQFSRMGRQELREASVDMNILIKEVLERIGPDMENRTITWHIEDLPTVPGDYSMLEQVWINLLGNAVKFSQNTALAEISVGFKEDEGNIVFSIRDNGIGFDMQYAHKLFGVFQRLHSQAEFEGTGIGLATVQHIVHRHNGRVWAESEPGKGSTFYVSLPKIKDT